MGRNELEERCECGTETTRHLEFKSVPNEKSEAKEKRDTRVRAARRHRRTNVFLINKTTGTA